MTCAARTAYDALAFAKASGKPAQRALSVSQELKHERLSLPAGEETSNVGRLEHLRKEPRRTSRQLDGAPQHKEAHASLSGSLECKVLRRVQGTPSGYRR